MSSLTVEISRISKILPHPNADKLEKVHIKGWECLVPKGRYRENELVVYVPIDSVLPLQLSDFLGVTPYLTKQRVRTVKLREEYSQGLVFSMQELKKYLGQANFSEGQDIRKLLKIEKYQPSEKTDVNFHLPNKAKACHMNLNFRKYTDIEKIQNYPQAIQDGDMVVITEKIHGMNFRAGYCKYDLKKPKRWTDLLGWFIYFFNILTCKTKRSSSFVVGSHNVQKDLSNGNDKFVRLAFDMELHEKLKPGEVLYGELYGDRVQKHFNYGRKDKTVIFFDLMRNGEWVDYPEFKQFCQERALPIVPELYVGPWADELLDLCEGKTKMLGAEHIREGCVIKKLNNRVVLKNVSKKYLEKDYGDLH